jgi:predicted secreted Zn-dependent protease
MSVWEPEEERFINRLKQTPTQRQIDEIRRRCAEDLKKAMQSFIGKSNTQLNQETINHLAQSIVQKHQRELDERGFSYTIKLSFTAT